MTSPPADNELLLKLPHPYQTPYGLRKTSRVDDASSSSPAPFFQIQPLALEGNATAPPEPLHNDRLFFTEPVDLKSSERPPESNNTPWGRARRSPCSAWAWDGEAPPTLGQAWLLVYVLYTLRPSMEGFRLSLAGAGREVLAAQLKTVFLAIDHPVATGTSDELLVPRGTFWQGAGSPFGPRAAWMPEDGEAVTTTGADGRGRALSSYPITPLEHVMTAEPGQVLTWHPRRPAKPRPGSVIYSRWVPHLRETFSMVAIDWRDPAHLGLFHEWQNDPRVSQGWNETGSLEQHREYLRKAHVDPHQVTMLACFDDTPFAYFEVYWGKEDRLGAYYGAGDYDRGRHSLVGDVRFRGPHRVTAWWSSLMHYIFLDDPRTAYIIGEPKYTNSSVLAYDFIHGFGLDKFVDLPHKRSAFVRCSRERFFQLSPLHESEKVVGGTLVGLLPKL
ncbi:putative aerobactin siderophore biosynthesis protein iucB [Rosellinia necatrix]|uniref:Putative aerobactin siderophore biosynthesis protein iucB n=1 Tax=Rosellinia necatrix TaxID=77044 RepID=A0A1W2TRH8_ROSNE|nr:putative aerobactin siderophore biosynthesis protein iucB [Rosellinia necatrix]